MKGYTFKIYDSEMENEERSDYWESKMENLYFTHPEVFAQVMSHTGICSFIKHYLPDQCLVLDGGCGSNYLSKIFDTEARKIVGVDFAVNSLVRGKEIYSEAYSIGGDLNCLPFLDDSFDAILSISTAEHIESGPRLLFEETQRVLKKGGLFLCFIPTYNIEDLLINRIKCLCQRNRKGLLKLPHAESYKLYKNINEIKIEDREGFFAYWFNRRSLKEMLNETGFTIDKSFELDVLGGVSRSRIIGKFVKRFVEKSFLKMLKKTPDQKYTWTERVLLKEDIYGNKLDFLIHKLIGSLYRYAFAFVCHKK